MKYEWIYFDADNEWVGYLDDTIYYWYHQSNILINLHDCDEIDSENIDPDYFSKITISIPGEYIQ